MNRYFFGARAGMSQRIVVILLAFVVTMINLLTLALFAGLL